MFHPDYDKFDEKTKRLVQEAYDIGYQDGVREVDLQGAMDEGYERGWNDGEREGYEYGYADGSADARS